MPARRLFAGLPACARLLWLSLLLGAVARVCLALPVLPPLTVSGLPDSTPLPETTLATPTFAVLAMPAGAGEQEYARLAERLRAQSRGLILSGVLFIPVDNALQQRLVPEDREPPRWVRVANSLGEGEVLAAAIGVVYLFGDRYDRRSARQAAMALLNAGIWTQILKGVFGRGRPRHPEDAGVFTGPTLEPGHKAFPSGHSAAAFSVATVFAERYPDQRTLFYLLATPVLYARVRLGSHFVSDTLAGAGVGVAAANAALSGDLQLFAIDF